MVLHYSLEAFPIHITDNNTKNTLCGIPQNPYGIHGGNAFSIDELKKLVNGRNTSTYCEACMVEYRRLVQ
ncbi:hypothetical protein EHR02_00010 [Leptospira levettii]|uniref:hypothetical protein n=1 Tax=Leptospira levettii TaxID=2023178 RepID=UPI001083434B|nr:hypothetical protein [Leptospira levettii]TGM95021.1 hypothetical protein EHR02_00010 [Leptospira levettii]